jgi:hypothetical protein
MLDFNRTAREIAELRWWTPRTCCDCNGRLIYGAPLHKRKWQRGDRNGVEYRCQHCSEVLAIALWPEDFGACPHQSPHYRGNA